jgi:hypothetical protein
MIESARDARFFRQVAHLETTRDIIEPASERYSFDQWLHDLSLSFSYNGIGYQTPIMQTQSGQKAEPPAAEFESLVSRVFKRDGVVFGAITARALLLSETTFKFRNLATKELFGGPQLLPLEDPAPNVSTGELLIRAEQDVSIAGNWYCYRNEYGHLVRLNPQFVSIMIASDFDPDDPGFAYDARVTGYLYDTKRGKHQVFMPEEIVHWSPIPDPVLHFRGMSWLQPIIKEALGDQAITEHKLNFMGNAATPNMVVKFPESLVDPDQYRKIREAMSDAKGVDNAGKTLYLMAGADVTVVGAHLKDLDLKAVQSVYENRIAVAARVPAVVLGTSEGMQGASLNSGNFAQAKKSFSQLWYHPTVKSLCAALARLVDVPAGAQLWFDPQAVALLNEDMKEIAETSWRDAATIRQLVDAGFEATSVTAYVVSRDPRDLKHTGLPSVQLQQAAKALQANTSGDTEEPV